MGVENEGTVAARRRLLAEAGDDHAKKLLIWAAAEEWRNNALGADLVAAAAEIARLRRLVDGR